VCVEVDFFAVAIGSPKVCPLPRICHLSLRDSPGPYDPQSLAFPMSLFPERSPAYLSSPL